ncbi:MAG: hypothetical protein HC927_01765 [Deltaproteobacteria bacterium]|nr:hypothetical protein [Deltaproteobacteria bacterium]
MTHPRCVLPGKTYLITRRCSERRFFLRPDEEVTHVFKYVLARACEMYGVELHAFVAMSNHYHLVATDPYGRLPDFEQYLNSQIARALNCHWGREESFWDPDSYNAVDLIEDDDVLDKIAYTLANPVNAYLVTRARQWEGATSVRMSFDEDELVVRPKGFFGKDMPQEVQLRIVPPPGSEQKPPELVQRQISNRVRAFEEQRDSSRIVLNMKRVRAQHWNASPETVEERGRLKPKVAARRKWARIEALQRCKEWLASYYDALARFCAGERGVEWPHGTWKMCVKLGCPCATG